MPSGAIGTKPAGKPADVASLIIESAGLRKPKNRRTDLLDDSVGDLGDSSELTERGSLSRPSL